MIRLKELRTHSNLSQQKMADVLGISRSAVAMWETGGSEPDNKTLEKIADYFNVSIDYLLGRDDTPRPRTEKKGVKIPVLGRVAAGIPITAVEEVLDYEEIEESLAKTGDFYGLQIRGTSMEPKFSEGDVVIVRQQNDVESGEIAIVLVNGDDATCKRVVKHENGLSLISLNPSFPPKFFTDQEVEQLPVRIIGRVMELRAKF